MSIIKPLLASEAPELSKIQFPILVSAKLDGIRVITTKDGPQSRSGKLIPSIHIQNEFKKAILKCPELIGMDGELIVGNANAKDVFRVTTSAVMAENKTPEFVYYVFDHVGKGTGNGTFSYTRRYEYLCACEKDGILPFWIEVLPHIAVLDVEHLISMEELMVSSGYEGLIIRNPNSPYKHGRSSTKEGILLKMRRFKDSEAKILDFNEEMENQNVATKDVFGRSERSTHQDNLVGKNSLGSFTVEDLVTKQKFQIGTGYSRQEREEFWKNRNSLIGNIVKYRFFEVGVKELPRFPVFQGFRDKRDMS